MNQDRIQDDRENRIITTKRRSPSFDAILRRFFRETQQSRILSIAKEKRFKTKDISRKVRRRSATRKARIRALRRGY